MNDIGFGVFTWIGETFSKCIDVNNHNAYIATCSKVSYLFQIGAIVDKIVIINIVKNGFKMFTGDIKRLFCSLFDGDRGHYDDKFGEAILTIEFKNGFEVDIGFTCSCFHLH